MSDEEDSLFNSKLYFNHKEAREDLRYASGTKETAVASAKLVGKTASNLGVFAAKLGFEVLRRLPEAMKHATEEMARKSGK